MTKLFNLIRALVTISNNQSLKAITHFPSMADAKKRKPKQHYVSSEASKKARYCKGFDLPGMKQNMQGVLITANFLGGKCKREMMDLLNDYTKSEADVEDNDNDAHDEISKEIEELNKTKTFATVDIGVGNILFVACQDKSIDIKELVHRILVDMRDKKIKRTRFTQRMLPITHTCYSSQAAILVAAKDMLPSIFYNSEPKTFGIVIKVRNNTDANKLKMDTIKKVAEVVTDGKTWGEINKVNLDKPQYTILIHVLKTHSFMSVVEDFHLLSKYNVDQITQGNLEEFVCRTEKKSEEKSEEKEEKSEKKEETDLVKEEDENGDENVVSSS